MRVQITFESGEKLFAKLNAESHTARQIYNHLPFESTVVHSRWSGREINCEVPIAATIPREDQTIYTGEGEICYWRDWRSSDNDHIKHVIAIYYGAETTRSKAGEEPVNPFGKIEEKYIDKLRELGEAVWLKGTQKIKLEKA